MVFYYVKSLKTDQTETLDDDIQTCGNKDSPLVDMEPNLKKIELNVCSVRMKNLNKIPERQLGTTPSLEPFEEKQKMPKFENRKPVELNLNKESSEDQDFMDLISEFFSSLCCLDCKSTESAPKVKRTEDHRD
jgi:predicted nucleic-acid-binding Zn-ribbon protein